MPAACGVPVSQLGESAQVGASQRDRRQVGAYGDASANRSTDQRIDVRTEIPAPVDRNGGTPIMRIMSLPANRAADHSPPGQRRTSRWTTSVADATAATLRPVSAAAGSVPARRAGSSRRRPARPTDRGRHTPQARAVAAHVRPGPGFVPGPTSGPGRVSTSCRGLRGDAHGKPSGEPSGAPCPTLPSRGSSRPGVLTAPDRSCRRCPAPVARSRRQRRQQRCPGALRVSRRTLKRTDFANHCV
jgi:hypothetical protein